MSKNTQLGNLVNGIFVNSTGNSVGVKTTTPRATLDVNGNIYSNDIWIADTYGILFGNLTTGTSYAYIAGIGATGASSYLSFSTNAGEKMRIDNNGSVGIGTSSPSVALDVVGAGRFSGNVNVGGYVYANSTAPASAGFIPQLGGTTKGWFATAGTTGDLLNEAAAGDIVIRSQLGKVLIGTYISGAGDAYSAITVTNSRNVGIGTTSPNKLLELAANSPVLRLTTTTQNTPSSIELGVLNGGNYGYAKIGVTNVQDYDTNLTFWTTPATSTTQVERMRITKDGNVGIGTNDPVSYSTRTLQIHNSVNNHAYIKLTNIDTGAALSDGFELASAGVNANIVLRESTGIITIRGLSGGVYLSNGSTSWAANSDERLKNINSNIENAVEKLSSLRAVNFSWKSDLSNREVLGLIAQDVEKAFPQIIDKNKIASDPSEENIDTTEYLGVRYVELIPVLVKAIQELKAEIDILKNK